MADKVGRPTTYTVEIAEEICLWLASGKTLRKYCDQEGKPCRSAVQKWLIRHKEFADQYALAKLLQREQWEDECIEIADDGRNDTYLDEHGRTRTDYDVVHRSRLRIDTRKWICGNSSPKEGGLGQLNLNAAPTLVLKRGPSRKSSTKEEEEPDAASG